MSAMARHRATKGFSLLVLAIWLLGIGLAVTVVLALLPNLSDDSRIDRTIATMDDARDELLGFVVENYRLPEPDTNDSGAPGYGSENPGADSGSLPYRSMELPAAVLDQTSLPLRYTPYRNSADDADLASAVSLYEPDLPEPGDYGCAAVQPSPINLLDFCVALDNADSAAASTDFASTGPDTRNAAYVLVSGGLEDADGDGADSSLDGANDEGDPLAFEDPARGRGKGYDDIVRATPVSALQRELSCNALVGSLELLVLTAEDSKNLADGIQIQYDAALVQVALDSAGLVLQGINLAIATASLAAATKTATAACAAAAACLGVCPNLTGACVAAAGALTSAIAAEIAAIADLALSLFQLGVAAAIAVEAGELNTAARQHVCDVIDDVVGADQRGGLR